MDRKDIHSFKFNKYYCSIQHISLQCFWTCYCNQFFHFKCPWLTTLIIAIYYIVIKKCIISHKYWMIRNYAITSSAITFRIIFSIFIPILGLEIAYQIGASNCFFWNIILAEIIIKKLKQIHNVNQSSPGQATQVANSDIIKGVDKSPSDPMNLQEQI
ncbi:membrane protein (macronuclear) [Tetrahymena thermophila SB210]|uniref:Membrane protein n=1 Tax=Tetrahymena thermophila (strain SB210) TaxID=312017 RepID=W7XGJ2_TETTS|nr:membrane protein [Tetrahymena thermophila SB210]EWS73276.1 membrane protein [Tetrahymena thermophila SB210]|eukprot:XP_012654185.1 membrane protein [Tetrahymena thermophila SB210]